MGRFGTEQNRLGSVGQIQGRPSQLLEGGQTSLAFARNADFDRQWGARQQAFRAGAIRKWKVAAV
jgi:hypothetical protein